MMYWQENHLPWQSRQQCLKAIKNPFLAKNPAITLQVKKSGSWDRKSGKLALSILHEVNDASIRDALFLYTVAIVVML